MNLKQCNKAELLWVIDRMRKCGLTDEDIETALNDLSMKINDELAQGAEWLEEKADRELIKYNCLMEPYEECLLKNIPLDVLEKASAALNNARELQREAEEMWRLIRE